MGVRIAQRLGNYGQSTEEGDGRVRQLSISALFVVYATTTAFAGFMEPFSEESDIDSGISSVFRDDPRTYQEYIAAGTLGVASPTLITGVRFRLAVGDNWRPQGYTANAWPSQDIHFANYSIQLGRASSGLVSEGEYFNLNTPFTSNTIDNVTVRDSALTIPAGSFHADGGASGIHAWGPVIEFDTPYLLQPGQSLVMTIRLTGYGTGSGVPTPFFASRSYENNVADAVASTAGANASNPSGFGSPVIVSFVPEPATIAFLAIGTIALFRRRR